MIETIDMARSAGPENAKAARRQVVHVGLAKMTALDRHGR